MTALVIGWMRAAFALSVLVLASAPAMAQFIVRGVEIDASADTAFDAQRQAMADGQVRAAQILVARLTLPEDRIDALAEPMTTEVAAELIAGLQISDEQRSSTRYRGVLAIEFDRRAVRAYLNGLGIAFVESQAAPVVVVPVLESPEGRVIWSGPWLRAWRQGNFETSLTPSVAVGAVNDSSGRPLGRGVLSVDDATNLNEAALGALAELYGVDSVLVVLARQGGGAVRAAGAVLTFTDDGVTRETLPAVSGQSFADAASRVVETRELAWKRASIVRGGEEAELEIVVLFNSLSEWRRLQQAVAGASLIESARLDALSRTGAAMTLTYRGTREQIASELNARGARLEEDEALGWTVRSR